MFSRDPVVISQTPAINSWSGRNPTESLVSQPPPVAERDSESSIGVSITVNFTFQHQLCLTELHAGSGRWKSESKFIMFCPKGRRNPIITGDVMEMK